MTRSRGISRHVYVDLETSANLGSRRLVGYFCAIYKENAEQDNKGLPWNVCGVSKIIEGSSLSGA